MVENGPAHSKIVICGAGISGIATAYFLCVAQGITDVLLIDKGSPLSLTSDKSTECYRNWWPGPGDAMVSLMNRSITLMEGMANANGNLFQMNQRGYLYVTTREENIAGLQGAAEEAASLGAGDLRIHDEDTNDYQPHQAEGIASRLDGADLILNRAFIQKQFPYLSPSVCAALHVRRAGWLSAQQYGMWMLEQAKARGLQFKQGNLTGIDVEGGCVRGIQLADGMRIACDIFVNAAGPLAEEIGDLMGVELPLTNELHLKSSIEDGLAVLEREAPLVICADSQRLDWTAEESEILRNDPHASWLLTELPMGAHTRPEGGLEGSNILLLWDARENFSPAKFPIEVEPMEAEIALRGIRRIIPGLQAYLEKMPRPFIDGGYYTKTQENRPLATPLSIEGAHFVGASSGYGIMAAAGLGELVAQYIAGQSLPEYAAAFHIKRYQGAAYQELLKGWGQNWQL